MELEQSTSLTSDYTTKLQSSRQAQRQRYRSMEQNRKPRDKSMHLQTLVAQRVKRLPAMQETWVQFLGQEDSPGEGKGNPLWYSCLENPMDGEAW